METSFPVKTYFEKNVKKTRHSLAEKLPDYIKYE